MRLSLRSQLLSASMGGIALVSIAAIGGAYWSVSSSLESRMQADVGRGAETAAAQLTTELASLTNFGQLLAGRPDLVQAVEKNDRATIRDIARNSMESAHLELVTICDKTGTVLGRGHSDKAGDSLLNQSVVTKALAGQAHAGIEPGTVAPFMLRSGCPIRNGKNVVGVVTVGTDPFTDHRFVDSIKKRYGLECTIFHHDTRISTTITCDGKRVLGTTLNNPAIKKQVLEEGTNYYGMADILGASYGVSYAPLRDADNRNQGMLFLGRPWADVAQARSQLLQSSLGPMALAAAVALGLSILLAYRIATPLRILAQGLVEITSGQWDLTRRFPAKGEDEVAAATRSVNMLLEKLQGVLHDLAGEAAQISTSSSDLSAAATQLSGGTQKMAGQSSMVTSAADHLVTNISGMAASTEEMSANAKTIASAVEEMTASIGEVARNAEQAASAAANVTNLARLSNGKINDLGTAAGEIGTVVEVIKEIAEQTKLLALNATIEAARAGDAGKGFAVVANEVKLLARQTAEATSDIERRIGGIQASTTEAVLAMGQISRAIEDVHAVSRSIASAVEEQSITTKEIASNVAQNTSAIESVAEGVTQSASLSQEINGSIHEIDATVQEAAAGAAVTEQASRHLEQITHALKSLVEQFRIDSQT